MRSLSTSVLAFGSAAEVLGDGWRVIEVQAAEADIMQAKVAAVIAEIDELDEDWILTHVSLAGAGDGHTFICTLTVADEGVLGFPPVGIEVEEHELAIFFCLASGGEALAVAADALRPQIAALFGPPALASRVDVRQTLDSGASKGARVMGAFVCEMTPA